VTAAICLLSYEDGLLITMAMISSEQVSQPKGLLPPAENHPLAFVGFNELSQLTKGSVRRLRASAG